MDTNCKTGNCKKGVAAIKPISSTKSSSPSGLKPCFSCQEKKPDCKHKEPEPCVVEPICCAVGRIILSDDCGREFEVPWESQPSDVVLAETVEALAIQLEALITKPTLITTQDIVNLGIVCENSALTSLPNVPTLVNGDTISITVGEFAVEQLVAVLNTVRGAGTITGSEATFRVQSTSLLFLTIQLFAGNSQTPDLRATLSGQFHIEECGRALCFDWANLNYTVVVPT